MDTNLLNRTWISGRPVQVDNLIGTAFTGEAGAHTFIIAGKDVYGNDVPITGEITAKFLASNQVTVPLVGSIGNGSAFITLSDTCYLVPGRFVLSIYATNGNYTTCIYCGVGNVFATSSDIAAYPTTATPDLNQLIRDVQAAISSVPADYSALINSIATTFDPQKTGGYGIGEYVWYNGVLYRFKEPHTGGWQASHVDQVILANDLTSVAAVASAGVRYDIGQGLSDTQKATARENIGAQEALTIDAAPTQGSTNPVQSGGVYSEVSALKSAIDEINGVETINGWTENHFYIDLTKSVITLLTPVETTDDVRCIAIPATEGDIFELTTVGGNKARAYGFITYSGSALAIADANVQCYNLMLRAPEGTEYLIVNDTSLHGTLIKKMRLADLEKSISEVKNEIDYITENHFYTEWSVNHLGIALNGTTADVATPIRTTGNNRYMVVPASENNIFTLTTTGGLSARAYAFIASDGTILAVASANAICEKEVVKAPEGTAYLVVNDSTLDGTVCSGATIEYQIKSLQTFVDNLKKTDTVDFAKLAQINYFINASNKWSSNLTNTCSLVPVKSHILTAKITTGANGAIIALLTSDSHAAGETPAFYGDSLRMVLSANSEITIEINGSIKYIYVYRRGNNDTDWTPVAMSFTSVGIDDADESQTYQAELSKLRSMIENQLWHHTDADYRDVPENKGVFNCLKKVNQLTSVQWTPVLAVPHRTGTFPAGTPVVGIPYSSVKELMKYVGKQVSFRTFMTAVHNPYSLLYTENVSEANSHSEYGFEYHGVNCATYYGMVCSSLLEYALGIDAYWETYQFEYLTTIGILEKVFDQSADGVKLGDVYWKYGHTRLITAVTRNEYNEVVAITTQESIGLSHRIYTYTAEEFNEAIASEGGILYRYSDIYKNLTYEATPFVNVFNEAEQSYTYNEDICTYAGDYAAFRCGEPVWINYTKGTYSALEIYLGETLVTKLNLPADSGVHKINITEYVATDAGNYSARLTNDSDRSDFTYWQMIDARVTVENADGVLGVTFQASNATPKSLILSDRAGNALVTYEMNETEIANGYTEINALELYKAQRGEDSFSSTVYIKVLFDGEYGTVINGLLDTGLYA